MTFYESLAAWSESLWPFLVNHLWQATLFCLFVLAVSALLKRSPARLRYSLWLLALAKFVLPATLLAALLNRAGIDFNSWFASASGNTAPGLGISPLLAPVQASPITFYTIEQPAPTSLDSFHSVLRVHDHGYFYSVLTLLWVAVSALLFASWLSRRRSLSATIREGEVVRCGRETEILERVSSWLGLRRKATLVISSKMTEPGVWGIFRPVVVLPEGISDRLTDDELEAVMLHEMVHVERWDNLIGVLQRIVCCLLWFHPLLWLLDRQLLAEREQACDDTVIKLGGASKVYASSITKVCKHSLGWSQPGLSNAAGSNLKRRIGRILAADVSRTLSASHVALLGMVAAVLFVLSSVAGGSVKGAAEVAHDVSDGGVDSRFVAPDSKTSRQNSHVATAASPAKLQPLNPPQDTPKQIVRTSDQPVRIMAGAEQIAPSDLRTIVEINQPGTENPRHDTPPLASPTPISATIIPVSAKQSDLSRFTGRYEVDPAKVENFVLDITLEGGELWLKPSHVSKRKLLLTGDTRLTDVESDFRFTVIQDGAGRVTGLRLDSWNSEITARKILLPQPSLTGNMTFRLSGHADARIVAVAGSFNDWNQSQFLFSRVNGEWICRVNLPPGKYEYKFIIDGTWLVDPRNPKTMNDERGNENSVLVSE